MRRILSLTLTCLALLPACRSTPPTEPVSKAVVQETPIPANRHVLSGHLINLPVGSEVELALLEVNAKARPVRTLGDTRLRVQSSDQSFQLAFDPATFPNGQRVELRGRVVQSGQLTMRLPARTIALADNQSIGSWQAVPAP